MPQRTFNRGELYELVWSEPMKTLAARYGISDVALAKTCRHHGIPAPPRGHWAKLQAGKETVRPPLPSRGLGMPETIRTGWATSWLYQDEPGDLIEMKIPPPPEFPETISDLTARVRKIVGKVSVPKDLTNAHRLIAGLLKEDDLRREKQRASPYLTSWDAPLFDSPFERRRLRLLNAIFVALERCGMKPSLRGKDPSEFGVRIGDQPVSFELDRPGHRRDGYRFASGGNNPATDKLHLRISHRGESDDLPLVWEDKAGELIERHVEAIVVGLIVAGEIQCRRSELSHHKWLIERKARLIEEVRERKAEEERQERERRVKAEQARVDRLLGEAAAFRQAYDIRAYVESVCNAQVGFDEPVSQDELDAWAQWALAQADRIDPVRSKKFLMGIDDRSAGPDADRQ